MRVQLSTMLYKNICEIALLVLFLASRMVMLYLWQIVNQQMTTIRSLRTVCLKTFYLIVITN